MIPLFLLIAAQQPVLTATPSVTLQQLLDAADRANVDRQITLEQQERAEAELRQAWTSLLPGLSVTGAWTHNQFDAMIERAPGEEPITIFPKNQLEVIARVEVPLIDTGRWLRASAASANVAGAEERTRLGSDQVKRAVTAGWYSYAAALAVELSAERSVALAEEQLRLQEIRMRTGTATELELLRARAEIQRNRQSVADAVRLIALARRALRTLTGMDPGDAARLPPIDLRPPASLEEMEAGLDRLPAVRAAEEDLRGIERLAMASKLALIPSIGAHFTERATNATSFTGEAAAYTLGVNLAWRFDVPTFMAMDVQSSNAAIAALMLEKTRLQARDQINTDWQALTAALTKVTAAEAQLEASQRARTVATKRYEVGAATQIEVIQADRDRFTAEVQHIQAQSELASARIALQISAGLPTAVE